MVQKIPLCRSCKGSLLPEPLLRLEGMPASAQGFLDEAAEGRGDDSIDLDVYQCARCGLVQLAVEPVPYYRSVIRASAFSSHMRAFRLKQFEAFVRRHALADVPMLEVGCGRGEYMTLMGRFNRRLVGIEYDEQAVAEAAAGGLEVYRRYLDAPRPLFENRRFGAFYILNYLEHIPDLEGFFAALHANLGEGATGLIEVPNFDMMIRDNLITEFIADHLLYFTRQTLQTTLALHGFEVLSCETVWNEYILSAEVRKRRRTDLSPMYGALEELKRDLHAFVADRKTAVWGAGHQSLALLALSGLHESIAFVVDSAPFKQGRYTPATRLKILPPEAIEQEKIEGMIVAAGGYNREIVDILQNRYRVDHIASVENNRLKIHKENGERR